MKNFLQRDASDLLAATVISLFCIAVYVGGVSIWHNLQAV